jgi:ParB family chromosome partitioning protein
MTTTTHTTIPLDQLRIDEAVNVRKIGRGADADFVASIKAVGIQMPLIVRKNGKGYVIADGGKRYEAAMHLVKKGDMKADAAIPVIVTDASDAEARELSLTLNLIRADMHPVDAFRAFSTLHVDKEKPLDVDAIANRFGIDIKTVQQRLALGALDDTILNAWQKGEIKAEVAQAFTLCPEKKEQARLFTKLKKQAEGHWDHKLHPSDVKEALKVGEDNIGRYLNAVGIGAYEARGGKVTRDLFGDDHIISDATLLNQMTEEKLKETCQTLMSGGWKWATFDVPKNTYEFGRLQAEIKPTTAEKKRLTELLARMEDDDLDQELVDKASDDHDALEMEIRQRAFNDKQKASAGCFVSIARDGSISIDYGRTEPKKVKMQTVETVDAETGKTTKTVVKKGKAKSQSTLSKAQADRLTEQRQKAFRSALVDHPHANPFAQLLARVVSAQINPGSRYNWAPHAVQQSYEAILASISPKVMNAAMRKAFDVKDYFQAAPKSFCLAAITEAVNADEARKISGKKKAEIAKFATVNVGKTKWLPKELRAPGYDGPAGKAAKKPAKAKSKKR